MASPSNQNVGSSSQQQHLQEQDQEQQLVPQITCSIPLDKLEVICELMVDFDNLEKHDVHLTENMVFQGWGPLFYDLCGPVYPDLVKEFWVHANVMPKAILSIVHGEFFSITEPLIRKLFGLMNVEGVTEATPRTDWDVVYAEIFQNGQKSK
ncbi:uncharacterized protein LOC131613644 [Vicia villosa]|uniref:uncharacterized protein LOC131613644 n=1 Tax=Vicia villosa TaxID=3911 RepID=UPI00273C03BA|nr:uncharacterized protein LOC131613644 [Vicia villosa]